MKCNLVNGYYNSLIFSLMNGNFSEMWQHLSDENSKRSLNRFISYRISIFPAELPLKYAALTSWSFPIQESSSMARGYWPKIRRKRSSSFEHHWPWRPRLWHQRCCQWSVSSQKTLRKGSEGPSGCTCPKWGSGWKITNILYLWWARATSN